MQDKSKKSRSKIHIPDDSSDSDVSSCESQTSTPEVAALLGCDRKVQQTITNLLNTLEQRSSSNSNEEDDDDEDDEGEEEEEDDENTEKEADKTLDGEEVGDQKTEKSKSHKKSKNKKAIEESVMTEEEIDSIWANKSPEYMAATPTFIKHQIDKNTKAQQAKAIPPVRLNEELLAGFQVVLSRSSSRDSPLPNTVNNNQDENQVIPTAIAISSSSQENYRKLKANPLFNPDMSINLDELVKLSPTTAQDFLSKQFERKSRKIIPDSTNPTTYSPYSSQDLSYNSVSSPNSSTPYSSTSVNQDDIKHANPRSNYDSKLNKSSYLPQFSRSAVGGSKFLSNCHPYNADEYDGLEFESRFESGNLAKAIQITPTYYELYLRPDLYTSRSKQWFYFRVKGTKKNMIYR